jgi:hypothetical protein
MGNLEADGTDPILAASGSQKNGERPVGPRFIRSIGQLMANDIKVARDTLVQLFCLSASSLIAGRYKYERTGISG